jgi:hypothetical protein
LYPTTSSTFASDSIAVGSTLSCPGGSPICAGYSTTTNESFGITSSSIVYNASGYGTIDYASGAFNGFNFTGITFADAGSLEGFSLSTDIPGLTPSLVSFTPNSIEVNLASILVDGTFTLTLNESAPVPEPGSLPLIATGLAALAFICLRRTRVLGC